MALIDHKAGLKALSQDRRRFQRVRVNLLGRYMLADRREFPCQVVNMSPGNMAVIVPVSGAAGERIIAYIDHLGRLEGRIARTFENGFAMTISATARKRDKLAAQLTWLANRHILGLPEDRRHGRIVPRNPIARLILPNGLNLTCRIIDVSESGAGIATDQRPAKGTLVMLGKVQGRVVRHLEEGFAIEFTRLQHPDFLEENVTAG
jgi:PilZ domain